MASVNKVIIVGNLGKDPEVRYTASGDAIANFSVATSEQWKDKATGEKREAVEWHRMTAYRRLGEIAGEYLQKGSQVYIEGKLTTRKWQDKSGVDRYTTEIIVETLQLLGKASGNTNPQGDRHTSNQGSRRSESGHSGGGGNDGNSPAPRKSPPSFDDLGDDLPF